ncbi:MAG: radical SAM family heme chaperone HemW [Bacteroidota bacterium]|nr:radical SAM family heme chaperone HemW [Bacteroidota bacterium]
MSGIYIHIPFCRQACIYCNFHFEKGNKNIQPLIEALLKEFDLRQKEISGPIETIYLGGGTPSYISHQLLSEILEKLKQLIDFSNVKEVTLEANPDDINEENLNYWKNIGFNRLSIGVQSFFDKHLKWMNRAHNAKEAEKSILLAQKMGFKISIDLIFGIPNATDEEWQFNIDKAINLGINHLSCYGLTLEENTPWSKLIKNKNYPIVNDESSSKQFIMAHQTLTKNGFIHYEISNYAKENHIAIHNTSYWKSKPYIGFGPSAHSFDKNNRSWNIADNKTYIESITKNILPQETELLSEENKFNELVMTQLRTIWGLDLNEIKRFKFNHQVFNEQKDTFINKKWIKEEKNHLYLTTDGMLYADYITSSFFI